MWYEKNSKKNATKFDTAWLIFEGIDFLSWNCFLFNAVPKIIKFLKIDMKFQIKTTCSWSWTLSTCLQYWKVYKKRPDIGNRRATLATKYTRAK